MLPSLERLNVNVGAFETHLNELPEDALSVVAKQKLRTAIDALDTATILRTCAISTVFKNACKQHDWTLEMKRMFGKTAYFRMYVESEPPRNFFSGGDGLPDAYVGMRAFILIADDLKRNCLDSNNLNETGLRVSAIGRKSVYFHEANEPTLWYGEDTDQHVKRSLDDFIFLVRGCSVRFGETNLLIDLAWYHEKMDRLKQNPPQLTRVVHALLPYVARSQSNRLEVAFLESLGLSENKRRSATASSYDQDVFPNIVSDQYRTWTGLINPHLADIIAPLLRPEAWILSLYHLQNTNRVERAKALFSKYPMARKANRSFWLRHGDREWRAFVWKQRPVIVSGVTSGFISLKEQMPPTRSERYELDKL